MNIFVIAFGIFAVLAMAIMVLSGPSAEKRSKERLGNIRDRHSDSATARVESQMKKAIANRTSTSFDSFATRILPNPANLQARIARTGKPWTLGQYLMATLGIFGVGALFFVFKGVPVVLAIMMALFFAVAVPHFVVGFLINRRIAKFNIRFPDAIELLVRGLRSGLPISETLSVVSSEIPGPVGEEFKRATDKMRVGATMEDSLQDVADRLGTPEFQFFVITLAIQRETGGNLAETLSNLSDVLRKRLQMKLKIKAMSSESKASAYIIGALPFIVFALIYTISDDYMQNFFIGDPEGPLGLSLLQLVGLGGLCWMSIGAFIMKQMISFEI